MTWSGRWGPRGCPSRDPATGPRAGPACRSRGTSAYSVQILPGRLGVALERALGLLRLRLLLLPLAVEEVVHQRGHFGDAFLAELPAEDHRDVLKHAAALRLVDRLRGRADEQQPRLLLAVLVVHGQVDLDRLVAQRTEAAERGLKRAVEAAADLARPADGEQQLLLVELEARLVGLEALHVGEPVCVEVVEQRHQRLLDLPAGDAFENGNVGVQVNFVAHPRILPPKIARMRPDYDGGSLVNLMASIARSRGGEARHAPLRNSLESTQARNVVLLIVDGLGDRLLMKRGAGGELARRRRGAVTAGVPSTTATPITTSYHRRPTL